MANNRFDNRNNNPYLAVKLSIIQERWRQIHCSFDLALITTSVYVFISLTGTGFLIFNKASEGAVTAACGLTASVRYIQIAKDTNNRKILAELDDET